MGKCGAGLDWEVLSRVGLGGVEQDRAGKCGAGWARKC